MHETNAYWEKRYAAGGTSGRGSYGKFAQFKRDTLNEFVRTHGVKSVIEFGCGDGGQLTLMNYPSYLGLDVSPSAVALCRERFQADSSKSFQAYDSMAIDEIPPAWHSDLALSLDVLYHLVERDVFEKYLALLFQSARDYVIIYSTNRERSGRFAAAHVRHRNFTDYVEATQSGWELFQTVPHPMGKLRRLLGSPYPDFYLYRKRVR